MVPLVDTVCFIVPVVEETSSLVTTRAGPDERVPSQMPQPGPGQDHHGQGDQQREAAPAQPPAGHRATGVGRDHRQRLGDRVGIAGTTPRGRSG